MVWTDDFLADTTGLDKAEIGSYLLLLLAAWRTKTGTLPDDDKMLARMARCSPHEWKRMRPAMLQFFEIRNQEWTQDRLLSERAEAERRSISAKGSARAGWEKRKNRKRAEEAKSLEDNGTDHADALRIESDRNASVSVSGLDSTRDTPLSPQGGNVVQAQDLFAGKGETAAASKRRTLEQLVELYRADFQRFYASYPRKKAPDAAARAYAKARQKGATHDEIIAGVRGTRWSADPTRIPYPATWLNAGGWKDDPDPEPETQLRTRL